MNRSRQSVWSCPKCAGVLVEVERVYRCEHGHSFDVAKQGYVNLLLANQKRSADPGDSKEMIVARRQFLSAGHFRHLMAHIAALVGEYGKLHGSANILDVGCGEGSYLQYLLQACEGLDYQFTGVDISKSAIAKAAMYVKEADFSVASNFNIPVTNASQNIVLSVFSPVCEAEIERVLSSNGIFIRVLPGKDHLKELREVLFGEQRQHESPAPFKSLTLKRCDSVSQKIALKESGAIQSLLGMIPLKWRASQSQYDNVLALETLSVTTDFLVEVFCVPS